MHKSTSELLWAVGGNGEQRSELPRHRSREGEMERRTGRREEEMRTDNPSRAQQWLQLKQREPSSHTWTGTWFSAGGLMAEGSAPVLLSQQ